jgi:hypothetical protein
MPERRFQIRKSNIAHVNIKKFIWGKPNWARAYLLWPTRMQSQWNHSRLVLVPLPREHTLLFSIESTCGSVFWWLCVSMRSKLMKKDSISTSAQRSFMECVVDRWEASRSKDFREKQPKKIANPRLTLKSLPLLFLTRLPDTKRDNYIILKPHPHRCTCNNGATN